MKKLRTDYIQGMPAIIQFRISFAFLSPLQKLKFYLICMDVKLGSHVVARVKNNPNIAHVCRKRRLKREPSAWGYSWATCTPEGIQILGVQLPKVMGLQH
jgi:hypothetical protein